MLCEMGPTFALLLGGRVLLIILTPGLSITHIRLLSPTTQAQTCKYTEEHIHRLKTTTSPRHKSILGTLCLSSNKTVI